jgi:molybdate transport system regulatory protein
MSKRQLKDFYVEIKLTFSNPNSRDVGTFGKEMALLLEGVDRLGSLSASAKRIPLSYSHVWRMLNETETSFGFLLVDRDGARGSTLTPRGKQLLTTYQKLAQKGTEVARQSFLESVG